MVEKRRWERTFRAVGNNSNPGGRDMSGEESGRPEDAGVDLSGDGQARELNFKHALWIIFVFILINQVYELLLALSYGFNLAEFPREYYVHSLIVGIVWYILMTGSVYLHINASRRDLDRLFCFGAGALRDSLPTVLKYFAGAALAVVALFAVFGGETAEFVKQDSRLWTTTVFVTVVMAPFCEELVFRGYLYTAMLPVFRRERERLAVNAMLFAAAHVFLVFFLLGAAVPYYIFVLGYLLAKLYDRYRSVMPCILLHALNNGLVVVLEMVWPTDWNLISL
ncbi:MAG: CPBP family intramembrane metalloprotease [bacterium]|nr:CPBP family intramembrane metalloprotease [bacterium]